MKTKLSIWILAIVLGLAAPVYSADSARKLLDDLLESDPFGLANGQIVGRFVLFDSGGSKSQLVFSSKSKRYDPPYAKSIVRFTAPSELLGVAFLQIQKRQGDDDRFLYLPDLKRPRRIAGAFRSTAFMGTDFSYADLDQRDFRDSQVISKGIEKIAKWNCDVIELTPKGDGSQYSYVRVWIRQDNGLPMKMDMYDRAKTLLKTFKALEFKRQEGHWFISRSRMTNHKQKHTTEFVIDKIAFTKKFADEEFTVRALEKP